MELIEYGTSSKNDFINLYVTNHICYERLEKGGFVLNFDSEHIFWVRRPWVDFFG